MAGGIGHLEFCTYFIDHKGRDGTGAGLSFCLIVLYLFWLSRHSSSLTTIFCSSISSPSPSLINTLCLIEVFSSLLFYYSLLSFTLVPLTRTTYHLHTRTSEYHLSSGLPHNGGGSRSRTTLPSSGEDEGQYLQLQQGKTSSFPCSFFLSFFLLLFSVFPTARMDGAWDGLGLYASSGTMENV